MARSKFLERLHSAPPSLYIVGIIIGIVYGDLPAGICIVLCTTSFVAYSVYRSVRALQGYDRSILGYALVGIFIGSFVQVYTDADILRFPLEPTSIVSITGVLKNDTLYHGSRRVRHSIAVRSVASKEGVKAETRGRIELFIPVEQRGYRGEVVTVYGSWQPINSAGLAPRTSELYQKSDAKNWLFRVDSVEIEQEAQGINALRKRLFLALEQRIHRLPQRISGLLQALFLGDRSYLDPVVALRFRESGNAHILALSGMHLSLLSLVVTVLLRLVFDKKIALCIMLAIITCYCILVGPIPSLIRAYNMVLVFCIARLCFVATRLSTVFFISFIVCAVVYPRLLHEFSFILSNLALAGIVFLLPPIDLLLRKYFPRILAAAVSASLAPVIASSPFVLYSFGVVYTGGIFVSALLGLIISAFLVLGILYIALPQLSVLVYALELLFDTAMEIVKIGRQFPSLDWIEFCGALLFGVVLYLLDQLFYRRKCRVLTAQLLNA